LSTAWTRSCRPAAISEGAVITMPLRESRRISSIAFASFQRWTCGGATTPAARRARSSEPEFAAHSHPQAVRKVLLLELSPLPPCQAPELFEEILA
jgi:hypothetical protein